MAPRELALVWLLAAGPPEPWLPLWAMELLAKVLLGGWLFYFGACVGSFLNVVVYRLPRGLNLVYPGSRCPVCGHAIRARDNLPIVSWLVLGGRCRDCRTPISPRYYYVELIVGLLFLLLAVFEAFLPARGAAGAALWSTYALHAGLAATLIGAALIEYDGFRVPRGLFAPLVAAGLALAAIWPQMHPLALATELNFPGWEAGLLAGLAGLAAGAALGLLAGVGWWLGSGRRGWPQSAPVALLAATGCVLGAQGLVEVAPLAFVTYVIGVAATLRAGTILPLAAVVLAWVLARVCGLDWSPLGIRNWHDPADLARAAAAAASVLLAALLAGRLAAKGAGQAASSQYFASANPDQPLAGPTESSSRHPS